MVCIFGNSHERVVVKDLSDVIYYRQKKQYTDQEFASSRDLQIGVQQGKLIKLEQKTDPRSSLPNTNVPEGNTTGRPTETSIGAVELKKAIVEALAEHKSGTADLKGLLEGLMPAIADSIRLEMGRVPVGAHGGIRVEDKSIETSKFQDVSYIPNISSEGMKSSITIEEKKSEGSSVLNGLEALRNLGKSR